MIYLRLFWEFFKTGLFSVGGGLATLPFIYDMSDRTGWFTYQQIADMVAVSESTPGPIGVNTATYVGYITGGVPGALVATLGLVTPAVICILIIASCLKKFRENRFVDHAFYGLRPASAALIAAACQQYRICGTGKCPVGIATQDPELRGRLKGEAAAQRVANFLNVSREELKTFARITGHERIHDLRTEDLCTISREISEFTNIPHV